MYILHSKKYAFQEKKHTIRDFVTAIICTRDRTVKYLKGKQSPQMLIITCKHEYDDDMNYKLKYKYKQISEVII